MKLTKFLSVAAIATTAFSGTLSAVDMTEFNGKNPAQLRAMAANYKLQASRILPNPYAGSSTDMLVAGDVNAYLAYVAADVKNAFSVFFNTVNTGGAPNDDIFNAVVATGVGGAGGAQPANLERAELERAFGAMIDGLDDTYAGFAGIAALPSRNLHPVNAQKARVDAGILRAMTAWFDALIPAGQTQIAAIATAEAAGHGAFLGDGGAGDAAVAAAAGGALGDGGVGDAAVATALAVQPFAGVVNTNLINAGIAADTFAELIAAITASAIHTADH
jgi:hypothetical protein